MTEIHVFERVGPADNGVRFVARLHPYTKWPIIFNGSTKAEAFERAEDWLADQVFKEKTTKAKRERALVKARRAKKS